MGGNAGGAETEMTTDNRAIELGILSDNYDENRAIETALLLEYAFQGRPDGVTEEEYLVALLDTSDKIAHAISRRKSSGLGFDTIFKDDYIIMNEVMPKSCKLDLEICYQIRDQFSDWSDILGSEKRRNQLLDYRTIFEDAMQLFIYRVKETEHWVEIESATKEWLEEHNFGPPGEEEQK
jgi:hypothetical protein